MFGLPLVACDSSVDEARAGGSVHAGSSLSMGTVENLVVTCAWHHWRFRLTDGAWADNPRIKTGCYGVEVVNDEICLLVPEGV